MNRDRRRVGQSLTVAGMENNRGPAGGRGNSAGRIVTGAGDARGDRVRHGPGREA